MLRAGERVGVAVSGGADSVALLRLLLELRNELGVVLAVVHFNHKLRGEESDADEAFVRELAAEHGLECFSDSGETRARAGNRGLEAAARELRYAFFWKLLSPRTTQPGARELDRIATAHTLEDQVETVVMRLARGAGTRGLAGIYPILLEKSRAADSPQLAASAGTPAQLSGSIVRPLLEFRRAQLRHYLRRSSQAWREDATNQDVAFSRNRVRHDLMPKLRDLNPAVDLVLSETAEIARAEEQFWQERVNEALGQISKIHRSNSEPARAMADIEITKLLKLPLALRRRALREFAARHGLRLEFHHVEQVLEALSGSGSRAGKRVELIEGWDAFLVEDRLRLEKRSARQKHEDYELALPVPGEVRLEAVGVKLRARLADSGARLKAGDLRVRNWRPGDRYWPAHTGSEKKVKELLQDRRVPAEARAGWPVVTSGDEIVWVPGFEYPEQGQANSGQGIALEVEFIAP
jgi:tRNA(Ile)-lysidine synthase